VLGGVPLCLYILKLLANNDPTRYYWLIVLSVAELYGGYGCSFLLACIFIDHFSQLDDLLPRVVDGQPELEHV
jgi:hypothetical protein